MKNCTARAAAAALLRDVLHGRIEDLGDGRILVNIPRYTTGETLHARRVERIATRLREAGWKTQVTDAGVEATYPTAVDVPFLSPALIRAAREAAAIDQRVNGERFTALTIKTTLYGTGWSFSGDAVLHYADGRVLIIEPFRKVDERLPELIKEQARRRYEAAQELRLRLSLLPFTGEPLRIPLHAYAG